VNTPPATSTAPPAPRPLYRVRHLSQALHDPFLAVAALARWDRSDQYVAYERPGEICFAAGELASLRISRRRTRVTFDGRTTTTPTPADPLKAVTAFLAGLPVESWRVYGWAAFEFAYLLQEGRAAHVPHQHAGDSPDDDLLHVFLPRAEVRIGPAHIGLRSAEARLLDKLTDLLTCVTDADPLAGTRPLPVPDLDDAGNYRAAVAEAVTRIRAGDLEKVILSRTVAVSAPVDLVASYVAGRRANTPARSYLLNLGRMRAAGFSPETVVEVAPDGWVSAQPLAGTRALTGSAHEDAILRHDLLTDPKEIYEHAVSVRAVWDELATLGAENTLRVDDFMNVRERGSVQHLASTVRSRPSDGSRPDTWPAFAALFPSITATGIPKAAAYELIRELEPNPRGLYAGTVLMTDSDGALDAGLVLRTLYQSAAPAVPGARRTWLQAGAGIVDRSTPEREHEETCEKLRSIAEFLVEDSNPSTTSCRTSYQGSI